MCDIYQNLELGRYPIMEVASGLENSVALNQIYGSTLQEVLNATCVDVVSKPWTIWVDRETTHITINKDYLSETDRETLYLDFVHEMIHLWQLAEGKDVFNRRVSYVDSPTEIEAYRYTIEDAKRIGFTTIDIIDYLQVRWIDDEEHQRLVNAVLS